MSDEEALNLDLDIYNILKPYEKDDDLGIIFLRSALTPGCPEDANDIGNLTGGDMFHMHNAIVSNMNNDPTLEDVIINSVVNFLSYRPDKLKIIHELLGDVINGTAAGVDLEPVN